MSGFCVIYQPIIVEGDVEVPEAPDWFIILPVPFLKWSYHGAVPYDAITMPRATLTDAKRSIWMKDSNLLSRTGIRIHCSQGLEEEPSQQNQVFLFVDDFHSAQFFGEKMTVEKVAEAALECIRRTAIERGPKVRPKLTIRGKKGDEEKWRKWEEAFNKHDFSKPFRIPSAEDKKQEALHPANKN